MSKQRKAIGRPNHNLTPELTKYIRMQLQITSVLLKNNGISSHRYALLSGRVDAYTQLIAWLKDNWK
ncbi:MAG: hypothetical protein ACHQ1D_01625 [Nitrososphaerales archaeon]